MAKSPLYILNNVYKTDKKYMKRVSYSVNLREENEINEVDRG